MHSPLQLNNEAVIIPNALMWYTIYSTQFRPEQLSESFQFGLPEALDTLDTEEQI